MALTDPRPLLKMIDPHEYESMLNSSTMRNVEEAKSHSTTNGVVVPFVEPYIAHGAKAQGASSETESKAAIQSTIIGKAYVLGDFVDTDAVSFSGYYASNKASFLQYLAS